MKEIKIKTTSNFKDQKCNLILILLHRCYKLCFKILKQKITKQLINLFIILLI
jgi:hypothetical protein